MKTDALVELLARSAAPIALGAADRRFRWEVLLAAATTVVVSLGMLDVRPDWRQAMGMPMFWGKLAMPLATALIAGLVLWRLVHPGMRHGAVLTAILMPTVSLWLFGLSDLAVAPPETRTSLVLGESWAHCLAAISVLSVPALALSLRAARLLAPTRLGLTGAVAGLFAGGVAAAVFSVYCREMAPAYVGAWYVLGMLVPAGIGFALGPKVLRW